MAGLLGCLMKTWPGTRWGWPSMPIPEWAGSMENMTSVSINNDRERPTIWPVNLGFSMIVLMMFSGTKIPGKCQSLASRLRRSKRVPWEKGLWGTDSGDAKRCSQFSGYCPQFGLGSGGRWSVGQFFYQWPMLPHLKQALSGSQSVPHLFWRWPHGWCQSWYFCLL